MTIDLKSLVEAGEKPLSGLILVGLFVLAAYLTDWYFTRTARR